MDNKNNANLIFLATLFVVGFFLCVIMAVLWGFELITTRLFLASIFIGLLFKVWSVIFLILLMIEDKK